MKIWIVGFGIPGKSDPRYGQFMLNQAKEIQKADKQNEILYIGIDTRSIRHLRPFGITIYKNSSIPIIDGSFPLGRVPNWLTVFVEKRLLKSIFKKMIPLYGRPDIIHAHFTRTAYIVSLFKDKFGFKFVITEHSSGINQLPMNPQVKKMAEYAYSKADSIIAVSPSLANRITAVFHKRVQFIPNMIDEKIFCLNGQINKNFPFLFLSVGTLNNNKRFEMLINAFCTAFSSFDSVELNIIGSGPNYNKIMDMINQNKRNKQIKLLGEVPNNQVANYLHHANCFVLASQSETFGVVYAEAIMCGIPAIATKCGGPECIINPSNGILVDNDNQEDLVSAMKEIVSNYSQYDSTKIAADAKLKYSCEAVVLEILKQYNNLY